MGWIQIKMGHPLAQNGAALAPFRAKGVASAPGPLFIFCFERAWYAKYVMLRHSGPAWVCPWRRLLSP